MWRASTNLRRGSAYIKTIVRREEERERERASERARAETSRSSKPYIPGASGGGSINQVFHKGIVDFGALSETTRADSRGERERKRKRGRRKSERERERARWIVMRMRTSIRHSSVAGSTGRGGRGAEEKQKGGGPPEVLWDMKMRTAGNKSDVGGSSESFLKAPRVTRQVYAETSIIRFDGLHCLLAAAAARSRERNPAREREREKTNPDSPSRALRHSSFSPLCVRAYTFSSLPMFSSAFLLNLNGVKVHT